jgi:Transposase DDE domain
VIAAELTCDSPDFGHLEATVRATQRELRGVALGDPHVVPADAGYWHQRQIEKVVSEGIRVLVSPDSSPRGGPRPRWTGGLYDLMRRVLATPDGRELYRRRQATIEPVFGQLKFNRRRFQRRGRAACRSEWRFIAATHDLVKLHRHRIAVVPV